MAPELPIKWTKRAVSDLNDIVKFISTDKPQAAKKLAKAIRTKTEALRTAPQLGREVIPNVRELVVHHHYLISYRVKIDSIEILQVWHTARQRF